MYEVLQKNIARSNQVYIFYIITHRNFLEDSMFLINFAVVCQGMHFPPNCIENTDKIAFFAELHGI